MTPMGYGFTDESAAGGTPPAPMHCEILMSTGAEAYIDITVIGAEGERRPPTTEEFYHIIKRLVKHQFTLKLTDS